MRAVHEQRATQTYFIDSTLLPSDAPRTPPMQPVRFDLKPSSTPPPRISSVPVVLAPDPDHDQGASLKQPDGKATTADRTLLYLMGTGRDLYSSGLDSARPLPPYDHIKYGKERGDRQITPRSELSSDEQDDRSSRALRRESGSEGEPRASKSPNLQSLAYGALQAVKIPGTNADTSPSSSLDISTSTRQLSLQDTLSPSPSSPVPIPTIATHEGPSNGLLSPPSGGLPSIASFGLGPTLPSLRSTLGNLPTLLHPELSPRNRLSPVYPHSPPYLSPNQLPPLSSRHCSPPISPPESYKRNLPSPSSLQASSPYPVLSSSSSSHGSAHRPSVDYTTGTARDVPSPDSRVPTEAPPCAVDRMSIEGITNQGLFKCSVPGCTAQPFQTQYLLNSHANVHSSARPHYCPVPGCPRGEAGMGFKRKNEMIRHGLVHDSPGYVCPFCPDKDRKYPRPDNLQRHVRSRHVDKDKNDPQLREVLEQRLEGPNRGRRRRIGSS